MLKHFTKTFKKHFIKRSGSIFAPFFVNTLSSVRTLSSCWRAQQQPHTKFSGSGHQIFMKNIQWFQTVSYCNGLNDYPIVNLLSSFTSEVPTVFALTFTLHPYC